MHSATRPKLGNAALIFKDDGQALRAPAPKWLAKHRWFAHLIVISLVLVAAGMIVTSHIHDISTANIHSPESSAHVSSNIDMIEANHNGTMLVGTLIRPKDAANHLLIEDSGESVTLTPKERERLLQIISN